MQRRRAIFERPFGGRARHPLHAPQLPASTHRLKHGANGQIRRKNQKIQSKFRETKTVTSAGSEPLRSSDICVPYVLDMNICCYVSLPQAICKLLFASISAATGTRLSRRVLGVHADLRGPALVRKLQLATRTPHKN